MAFPGNQIDRVQRLGRVFKNMLEDFLLGRLMENGNLQARPGAGLCRDHAEAAAAGFFDE
jgi:hypothetical protein